MRHYMWRSTGASLSVWSRKETAQITKKTKPTITKNVTIPRSHSRFVRNAEVGYPVWTQWPPMGMWNDVEIGKEDTFHRAKTDHPGVRELGNPVVQQQPRAVTLQISAPSEAFCFRQPVACTCGIEDGNSVFLAISFREQTNKKKPPWNDRMLHCMGRPVVPRGLFFVRLFAIAKKRHH